MKQTKTFLGIVAIVLLSAGVAGVTTYKLMEKNQPAATFTDLFEQNDNMRLASYNGTNAQPVDLTAAAEASVHAVVHIRSTQLSRTQTVQDMPDIFDFFFGDGRGQQRQVQTQPRVGFGSGVIISKDGYIVTNNHVVEGADEIVVKLNDERELKGRLIGVDPDTDLALVKIEGDDFPTLPIGDSEALKVGEWVLAVGNPFNLNSTVTAGIVSAKARSLGPTASNGQAANIQSFIQTDAAINAGNSGGALVNAYGTVQRALLGIRGNTLGTDLTMSDAQAEEMRKKIDELGVKDGVYVAEVVEDGSAAGVLQVDDVITAVDNKKVHKFSDLQEALAQHRPGDKVKVTVMRKKSEKTFDITLKNSQGNTKVVKSADMEILGAAFRAISDETKRQLNLSYGLEVTGVNKGKMQDAGIRKGFIIQKANNETIRSEEDLQTVLKQATQSPEQVLFISGIYPSGRRANYAVDLTQE